MHWRSPESPAAAYTLYASPDFTHDGHASNYVVNGERLVIADSQRPKKKEGT